MLMLAQDPSEHTHSLYFLECPLEIAVATVSPKTKLPNRQQKVQNCAGNKGFLRTASIQHKQAKN